MSLIRRFVFCSLMVLLISGCGKLESKVITAEFLQAGNPELYVPTDPFSFTTAGIYTQVLANQGFREGTIKTITFSDAAHYSLDATSDCIVGTSIKAGEYCVIQILYVLGASSSSTMTVEYEGAGNDYSAIYDLSAP